MKCPGGFTDARGGGTKILVLGTGHIYQPNGKLDIEKRLNHLQGIRHNPIYSIRSLYDPGRTDFNQLKGKPLTATHPDALLPDTIPPGSVAMVLSPSNLHADQLVALLNNKNVAGIYCEKPMVTSLAQLPRLEKALEESTTPVYFSDHMYTFALGAALLLGKPFPYKDFLKVEYDPKGLLREALENSRSVLEKIDRVEARTLERQNPLEVGRDWLMSRSKGGGVLSDLLIHHLDFLHLLGLKVNKIKTVQLFSFKPNSAPSSSVKKRFYPLKKDSDDAENYAVVRGTLKTDPSGLKLGKNAKFTLKAAKCWPAKTDDRAIVFKDTQANRRLIVRPNTIYDAQTGICSPIELYEGDDLIGKAHFKVYPYLLNLDHGLTYLTSNLARRAATSVMFFEEQKEALEQIEKMKRKGGM